MAVQIVQNGREPLITSLTNIAQKLPELSDNELRLKEYFDLNVQSSNMKAVFRRLFIENHLDVILMAGNQSVAPVHDTYGYSVLANLLN